ncbi:nitrate- and nitrite sensing domain-containing protein [Streptomyces sp. NPDC093595]|uniref:sensor histidine kinase n=1 Tax=Streptomyces sp. NPDC093595 TaxID=3366045 RepID=UPI003814CAD5
MSPIEPGTAPEGPPTPPEPRRRRRTVRLRTLLVLLAVVPTVAMGTQVAVTADRLLDQSHHLRADVAAGQRIGAPLYRLLGAMQAERAASAARWSGASVPEQELEDRRAATDRAVAEFRRAAGPGARSEEARRRLQEVTEGLDDLAPYRERTDLRTGSADSTVVYYTNVIGQMIRFYQDEFSHTEDAELTLESRVVVTMYSASEMLARQDTLLALAGPSRELSATQFSDFVNAVGAHRYLYDTWVVPQLPPAESELYAQLVGSDAWQAKVRIENTVMSDHKDIEFGVRLPREVTGWREAQAVWGARLDALNTARSQGLLARADAKADELESEVTWLITASAGALLLVAAGVVVTTRSVLRRLRRLHERTVTIAEETLPDVVDRLQRGLPVDSGALPAVTGNRDEVGRISDAFARVVAVSVDGHRQLAAERHGFGMFAAGIASRTGNLVSRQLTLTEELQDTFGHDETLLARLMRSDQLTVGMRRQIENLLILAGGEIPDPHTDPMRVADLLREAAAEVEDFRRIERQALDEISVEPRVISQISHLLAELLDNATRFSPPRSKVVIRAELVTDGLSVEIEDRGPRVTPAAYEEMNGRLHSAPPYAVLAENAHRLGLFVVGHLADRLGATVTLRRSVYGGTSAVVIVPAEHLVPTRPGKDRDGRGAAGSGGEREPVRAAPTPPSAPAPAGGPATAHETATTHEPAPETARVPAQPVRAALPRRAEGGTGPAPLAGAAGLPVRRTQQRAQDAPPVRPAAPGDGGGTRPPLPERVPQTHMVRQLREPRAPEATVAPDTATPEEVADAWSDYEHGTQQVEQELRREQP